MLAWQKPNLFKLLGSLGKVEESAAQLLDDALLAEQQLLHIEHCRRWYRIADEAHCERCTGTVPG